MSANMSTLKMRSLAHTNHYFFDRRTFNPNENRQHKNILTRLRMVGTNNTRWFLHGRNPGQYHSKNHYNCCASFSFREYGQSGFMTSCSTILDIGCGDSCDRLVAKEIGLTAYGLDLFPPSFDELQEGFTQGDAVEPLPFADGSFDAVIAQAMLDLVHPTERQVLYGNVFQVLKTGGVFIANIISLNNGWGFDLDTERASLKAVGFEHIKGNLFQKAKQ